MEHNHCTVCDFSCRARCDLYEDIYAGQDLPQPVQKKHATSTASMQSNSMYSTPAKTGDEAQHVGFDAQNAEVTVTFHSTGNSLATVNTTSAPGVCEQLGKIREVWNQDSGNATLQAICCKHADCMCWVSMHESKACDTLIEWLSSAHETPRDDHLIMSGVVRESLGMSIKPAKCGKL